MRLTRITPLGALGLAAVACGIDAVGAKPLDDGANASSSGGPGTSRAAPDADGPLLDAAADDVAVADVDVDADAGSDALVDGSDGGVTWIPPYIHVTHAAAPATVDLTAEGEIEWAHWGYADDINSVRKANTTNVLSAMTLVGASIEQATGLGTTLSWSNGDPTASGSSDWFNYVTPGVGESFTRVRAPSGPLKRTFIAYVGGANVRGKLTASFVDSSVTPKVDTSYSNLSGTFAARYVIEYASVAPTELAVRWEPDISAVSGAQIRWAAVALR